MDCNHDDIKPMSFFNICTYLLDKQILITAVNDATHVDMEIFRQAGDLGKKNKLQCPQIVRKMSCILV